MYMLLFSGSLLSLNILTYQTRVPFAFFVCFNTIYHGSNRLISHKSPASKTELSLLFEPDSVVDSDPLKCIN